MYVIASNICPTSVDYTFLPCLRRCYIPEFRDELFESGINLYVAEVECLKKNWLIPGIVKEIEKIVPYNR
jgi:hypothetical protein